MHTGMGERTACLHNKLQTHVTLELYAVIPIGRDHVSRTKYLRPNILVLGDFTSFGEAEREQNWGTWGSGILKPESESHVEKDGPLTLAAAPPYRGIRYEPPHTLPHEPPHAPLSPNLPYPMWHFDGWKAKMLESFLSPLPAPLYLRDEQNYL